MNKTCCDCGKTKPIDDFGNDRFNKDGKCYNCKNCRNEKARLWKRENKEKIKIRPEYAKLWRENNKDKCKKYLSDNRIKRNAQRRKRHSVRYKEDDVYRTSMILRRRFLRQISAKYKKDNILTIIGCSVNEFNLHIEKQFTSDMSWKNKGKWHFDHIIPCAHFDLTNYNEQLKCFHFTNYQPMWGDENSSKNDTLPLDFNRRIWDNGKGWILLKENKNV